MPQFGFYMAGVGAAGAGRAGLLVAWDPTDQGPSAADGVDFSQIALYSWIGPLLTVSPAMFKVKSRSPLSVPAEGCPTTLDGFPDHDYVVRFGVKPGGSAASLIADGWLEVFEGSIRVYGVNPLNGTIKVELASGSMALGLTDYSMQDRLTMAALEDPLEGWAALLGGTLDAIEIWRALMTADAPLSWNPL